MQDTGLHHRCLPLTPPPSLRPAPAGTLRAYRACAPRGWRSVAGCGAGLVWGWSTRLGCCAVSWAPLRSADKERRFGVPRAVCGRFYKVAWCCFGLRLPASRRSPACAGFARVPLLFFFLLFSGLFACFSGVVVVSLFCGCGGSCRVRRSPAWWWLWLLSLCSLLLRFARSRRLRAWPPCAAGSACGPSLSLPRRAPPRVGPARGCCLPGWPVLLLGAGRAGCRGCWACVCRCASARAVGCVCRCPVRLRSLRCPPCSPARRSRWPGAACRRSGWGSSRGCGCWLLRFACSIAGGGACCRRRAGLSACLRAGVRWVRLRRGWGRSRCPARGAGVCCCVVAARRAGCSVRLFRARVGCCAWRACAAGVPLRAVPLWRPAFLFAWRLLLWLWLRFLGVGCSRGWPGRGCVGLRSVPAAVLVASACARVRAAGVVVPARLRSSSPVSPVLAAFPFLSQIF